MFGLSHGEWICIFLIVLLIFGGKKLPEVARGLAKALHEFRKARDELHDVVKKQVENSDSETSDSASAPADSPAEKKDKDTGKTH